MLPKLWCYEDMIAELGQLALLFALVIAGWQALLPWLAGGEITGEGGRSRIVSCGNFRDDRAPGSALPYRLTRTLVYSQLAFISLSFLILTFCFVSDDFSVAYVANNSDISLPLFFAEFIKTRLSSKKFQPSSLTQQVVNSGRLYQIFMYGQ